MDFEKLPADWPTIPLIDPNHIADVLDIFVGVGDRMAGSLLILICDEQRRPVQPIIINDIDTGASGDGYLHLAQIAQNVSELRPEATAMCGIARRGSASVTNTDRLWAQTLERAFAGYVQLLGVHLITLDGTVPIPRPVEEAA
ncbi:MAG: hypothetical protein WCF04_10500 [Candidatus Nanopelagicales bacterium]